MCFLEDDYKWVIRRQPLSHVSGVGAACRGWWVGVIWKKGHGKLKWNNDCHSGLWVFFFSILFYCFYMYLYVYTLFGSSPLSEFLSSHELFFFLGKVGLQVSSGWEQEHEDEKQPGLGVGGEKEEVGDFLRNWRKTGGVRGWRRC
jgi:hypothetical protein